MTDNVRFVPLTGWSNVYRGAGGTFWAEPCPGVFVLKSEDEFNVHTDGEEYYGRFAELDEWRDVRPHVQANYRGTYRDDDIPAEVERPGFDLDYERAQEETRA